MKTISTCLLAGTMILAAASCKPNVNEKPFTIPEVQEWNGLSGNSSRLKGKIIIKDKDLRPMAELLAMDLKEMSGKEFTICSGRTRAGDICLDKKKSNDAKPESYEIRIRKAAVLSAADEAGLWWATRTLLQIAEQNKNGLPKGIIKDKPEYGMRGFMIDCGRKFIPMDYLRNLVKVMSYYKMNTLQVHLNDNGFKQFFDDDWSKTYSGFHLESETFPGLSSKDGYYTKDEFRAFQKEAAAMNVEIIPEIDAPAHTLAFSHYNPSLGSEKYGMDHMDLFNEECYEFMDALWKEYLEGDDPVFVGPRVHIGTDEYSNKDPEVVEKFRYFTDRYIKYVESFGKQACVWGALTHANGNTPVKSEGVIMSEWYNGYAQPRDMKAQGYDMISIPDGWTYLVPGAGYYYDYLDIKDLYENWTPAHIGEEVFEENDPQILGGMFAEWNDHVGNGISISDIHHRVFPGIQTMSEKCWSGARAIRSFEEFDSKRPVLSEAPGINELGREGFANRTFAGYGYKVSFTVDAKEEKVGTVLSECPRSTFYLSDPENGMLGFSRDGYLFTFNCALQEGSHLYTVECTNSCTRLYIDNVLADELDVLTIDRKPDGKARMKSIRTLVFPLQKTEGYKSTVSEFTVEPA